MAGIELGTTWWVNMTPSVNGKYPYKVSKARSKVVGSLAEAIDKCKPGDEIYWFGECSTEGEWPALSEEQKRDIRKMKPVSDDYVRR